MRQAKGKLRPRGRRTTMLQDLPDGCAPRAGGYHSPVMASLATPGSTSIEHLKRRPGVRLVPSPKIEMITVPGFLPEALCEGLMRLIDANRRPSTIADP